jgi:hypothetical protein
VLGAIASASASEGSVVPLYRQPIELRDLVCTMRGEEPDQLNGAAEELRREAAALLGGLDAVPEPGLKWRVADLAAIDERVGDAAVIVIDLAGVVTLGG